MAQTQTQRLQEAYEIHSRFHNWMGFLVCDSEEDMLALRKLVKKIERETVSKEKKKYRRLNMLANKYAEQISLMADGVPYDKLDMHKN